MTTPRLYSDLPLPQHRYLPGRTRRPHETPHIIDILDKNNWQQCQAYLHGIDLFNHGYWWETHEALEVLWQGAGKGRTKTGVFLQGIIQVAAALLKDLMNDKKASFRLLSLGCKKLRGQPGVFLGIQGEALATSVQDYLQGTVKKFPTIALTLKGGMMGSIYDFKATDIQGKSQSLKQYQGKVLLIVNTASKCGFTPQYKGLEDLYQRYKNQGVEILAFPCNQFGGQEPGDSHEIANFCELNYKTTFPLFEKVDVNGKDAHPLFQYLTEALPGLLGTKKIKWNFTKFLIDAHGNPIKRFASQDSPEKIDPEIKKILNP